MYQLYVIRIFPLSFFYVMSILFLAPSSFIQFFLFLSCGTATRFWVMTSLYRALGSHTLNAPNSVWLLWTSDQPEAETSVWQHTTLTRDKHRCPGGIRTSNPSKRAVADLSFILYDHWDQHFHSFIFILSFLLVLLFFSCMRASSKLHRKSVFAGVHCTGMEMSLVRFSHKLTGHINKAVLTRSDRCIRVCLCPAVSPEVLLTLFNIIITLPILTLCIACWLAAV